MTIPTNLDLHKKALSQFGAFYTGLFDQVLAKNKRAVVTEYSWNAGTCDPCPSPALNRGELMTLGQDVLASDEETKALNAAGAPPSPASRQRFRRRWALRSNFVLTRLHTRYSKDDLGEDLVFKKAPAIAGGRERRGKDGLEKGAVPAPTNNFQGRYAVRHPWTGPVECENPVRGVWGRPPGGAKPPPRAASGLGFKRPKPVQLAGMLKSDLKELDVKAVPAAEPKAKSTSKTLPTKGASTKESSEQPKPKSCGACAVGSDTGRSDSWFWLSVVGLVALRRRFR